MPRPTAAGNAPPRGLIAGLAVLAAGLCVLLAVLVFQRPGEQPVQNAGMFDAVGRDAADIQVRGADGQSLAWGSLNGAPRVVFFGFTHCPEICPTTLGDLSAAIKRIGPGAQALKVDFVSVDPERDTPDALRTYMSGFGPQFRGFTADPAELEKLTKSYRVVFRKAPESNGDYSMDHTTLTYLLDRQGKVVDIAGYQTPPERLDAQLKALLR
jgi:protein SCO1/2